MLIDARRSDMPELDARHRLVDIRTPHLRVAAIRSRHVVTDFRLLRGAFPILHHPGRSGLTLVLDGEGRIDEGGRRRFFGGGELVLNDQRLHGTEAYAGASCAYIALEWDASVFGRAHAGAFAIERVSARDRARLAKAARGLGGPRSTHVIIEILDVLRAAGLGLARIEPRALEVPDTGPHQPLQQAISQALGSLQSHPGIDDLTAPLRCSERHVRRRMVDLASRYHLTWRNWREAVHQARLLHASRLLGAPGATTEVVARLAGFRAPTALCHAFAAAGLVSPGRLAAAAKSDVLDRWSALAGDERG